MYQQQTNWTIPPELLYQQQTNWTIPPELLRLGFERCCQTVLALTEGNQETNFGFKCLIVSIKLHITQNLDHMHLIYGHSKFQNLI